MPFQSFATILLMIRHRMQSASRGFGDKKEKEEKKNKFRSMCSLLETHNDVELDVDGRKIKASGEEYFNGKSWVRGPHFGVDHLPRGKKNTFLSAVTDSPVLKKLSVSQLHHEKDGKLLLRAAGRNQSLQHLSINNPEIYSSSLAQFLQQKRSTLTKLTLHWKIEGIPTDANLPKFRSIVRAIYATLSRKPETGSVEDVGARCSNLAEGVLALEELKHIELAINRDMAEIYLCSVLEIVGKLPRLCSLTLDCRKERHIELVTVALKSSNSLDTLTLEGEVYDLLETCNTETVVSFFDALLSCRSFRELYFPLQCPGGDASSFVSHLIRLVNQHPNLEAIACRFASIDKAHQFCSSVKSSVMEELEINFGFTTNYRHPVRTQYRYPKYYQMLVELLSQLPNLKNLDFRHGTQYEYGMDRSEEEGVFHALQGHQTLTSMYFEL